MRLSLLPSFLPSVACMQKKRLEMGEIYIWEVHIYMYGKEKQPTSPVSSKSELFSTTLVSSHARRALRVRVATGAMDHPTSPLKMPVTIAPLAPWPVGVAADAHRHTPMKKSRSDEKLSDVDLQEARHQFHQMLSRERPELSNRDVTGRHT